MPTGGLIIGGIGALASAGVGAATSAADRKAQQAAIQNAINQFTSIGVPPAEAMQIVLQKYKSAGQLTPEMEQTFLQGKTNLSSVAPNQQDRVAQMNALNQLQQLGTNGGELLSDKAALNNTINASNTANRGRQQAILQNAQARGVGGSGASLAAQLDAAQNEANQQNSNALNIDAQAQQRALQAISQGGALGSQMEKQDYAEKANAAQAQDAIDRFNMANRQNVSNQNTQATNAANAFNLENNQRISDLNTGVDNTQAEYNSKMIQQNYEDQLQRAAGASGQYDASGKFYGDQAQGDANQWGNVGSGLAKLGTAYATLSSKNGNGSGGSSSGNMGYSTDYDPEDPDNWGNSIV